MKYETVIGFEVHVELATRSKVFCACPTEFGAPPNTQVCPVCLGMPGSLPVLNKRAVEYSLRAAAALNCSINQQCYFERKNYYYPDLPKAYQISQLRKNLGEDGWIEVPVGEGTHRIRINNIHLEEDAGKNVHPETPGADYSLVDLNRAGTPLLEIVTEPDIRSAAQAESFMQSLKNLLEYIEVSDCNMHEGRMRFEVNISLRPEGQAELPDFRSEIKNLASMKIALKVIEAEQKRMARALDKGEKLIHDTRLYDEAAGRTRAMRGKESANDYRYFPDPDLVDLDIADAWLEKIRAEMPELPEARKQRFIKGYGLSEYDAGVLTAQKALADYFEQALQAHDNPKGIANWIQAELLRDLNANDLEPGQSPVAAAQLGQLVALVDSGDISGKIGKKVFKEMFASGKDPKAIVEEQGLVQVKDSGAVEGWVDEVIAANPGPADDFRNGKDKAIGFLVGQVMRLSQGKANPQMVNEIFRAKLRG